MTDSLHDARHLDHDQCIETVMLKGPVKRVREFADEIIAERGVRHGVLNLVNVELGAPHTHDGTTHRHLKPHIERHENRNLQCQQH